MTHTKKKPFFLLAAGIILVLSILMGFIGVHSLNARADSKSLAGAGTAEDPYLITSWQDFASVFATDESTVYGNYKLANDISFYGMGWAPKADFAGTLDGNGKTIGGCLINVDSGGNYGIFKRIYGTVKNLTVDNVIITTSLISSDNAVSVGFIAGYSYNGRIINCIVKNSSIDLGKVKSQSHIGGIVGYLFHGRIENCAFGELQKAENTTLRGNQFIGGISGFSQAGVILGCLNYGNIYCGYVEGVTPYVGGISGTSMPLKAEIRNSCNVGNIKYIGAENNDKNFKPRMGQLVGVNGTKCEFDTEYLTNAGYVSSCRGTVDKGNLRKIGGFLGIGTSNQAEFVSNSFAGEYIYGEEA